MRARYACALLLCAVACARHDDDFAFDSGEEFQAEISNRSDGSNGLRRLWGIPDTTAYVGRLFRLEIPKEAFSGDVVAYKVRSADGRRSPPWLAVDSRHGLLSGVPLSQDLGSHTLLVTAHSRTHAATDTFTIEVRKSLPRAHSRCGEGESRLSLQLLLDTRLHQLPAKRRTRALMHLANFMALDGEEFLIESFKSSSGQRVNQTILQSGPGSSRRRIGQAVTSAIYLDVGCGGKMWPRHKVLVAGVREQARDGTLSHVLELPLIGWRLLAEKAMAPPRPRRQTDDTGSGDFDDEDEGDYDDYSGDDDYYNSFDPVDERNSITGFGNFGKPNKPPIIIFPSNESESEETKQQVSNTSIPWRGDPRAARPTPETPVVIVPVPPITTSEIVPIIVASSDPPTTTAVTNSIQTTTSTTSSPPTAPTTTTLPPATTLPSTTVPTSVVVTDAQTTDEITKQEPPTTTEKMSTIIEGKTTETIDDFNTVQPTPSSLPPPQVIVPAPTSPAPNQPPHLSFHMKKLAVTAGKAFRYLIPFDLFLDNEDGTNLTYSMYEADNTALKPNSWVQFLPDKREVYGLPLEEHVSRWGFTVQATDHAGAAARAPLDIIVQHHKQQRTLNHQFVVTLKVQQKYRYAIDWQIDALEALVNLFRSTDMEHIIVREVSSADDLVTFSWSDDTLAKDVCATADIQRIMSILESDTEKGYPSANLSRAMHPHLKVSSVRWEGQGACASTPPPAAPAPPSHDTFPPQPRNQVDLVRATAGHLLVHKVPPDTFYDQEDGDTRALKLHVVRGDRSPLPSAHWMQFDTNNQEFYGLPTDRDVGKKEYQLIAEDSSGKTANDVLIVEVNPAPAILPPVEFQITMNYPYAMLASSALAKRTFLESLAALFGDKDASAIRVKSITDRPTTVVWYNTSLPMDHCPSERIDQLKRVIIKKEGPGSPESLTDAVDQALGKHDVMAIRLIPRGACSKIVSVAIPNDRPTGVAGSSEKVTPSEQAGLREYIITFIIPAVVIVCMILIAAIIACALYRRRRTTGKMSVGDEEERQAFRSKGIPVIFQDELDEKPEPGNKSPVIMKEEKPPLLAPPDYKPDADSPTPSHHTPYRPPPPFTASRSSARPKATPTYRKPPPYVPP